MKEFWSPRIRDMVPYTPGEQPKNRKWIKLNTNENPYPPSPMALEAIRAAAGEGLRLYPDPEGTALRETFSAFCGADIRPEQIFLGNGSDEVLAFAFQAFFDPQREIVFPDITYSFYPVYAALFGLKTREIPLNEDFSIPVEQFFGQKGGVVLCNPNAPTGRALPLESIRKILEANPEAVVLVDEAYVDFGGTSTAVLLADHPNLLVVGTLSKSRSLAGLRVGYALGSVNLLAGLNCVKNSFNSYTLDRLALAGAEGALRDQAYFQATRDKILQTRARTAARLKELGFTVCDSSANFLFASHRDVPAKELLDGLRSRGILVRWWNRPRISNHLRITIGTDQEMDALCAALEELLRSPRQG